MNSENYRAPWRINRDPNDRPAVYDAEGNAVADCWRSVMLTLDEQRRNAALIAMAPRLLDELARWLEWARIHGHLEHAGGIADATREILEPNESVEGREGDAPEPN